MLEGYFLPGAVSMKDMEAISPAIEHFWRIVASFSVGPPSAFSNNVKITPTTWKQRIDKSHG